MTLVHSSVPEMASGLPAYAICKAKPKKTGQYLLRQRICGPAETRQEYDDSGKNEQVDDDKIIHC
jgi:hypothetical protein